MNSNNMGLLTGFDPNNIVIFFVTNVEVRAMPRKWMVVGSNPTQGSI